MFGKKISNVFLFLFFMVFLFCGRVYSEPLYLPLLTVFQDGHEVYTLGADRGAMGVQIGAFIKAELPIITTVPPLYQYKNEAIFQELKDEDKWRVYINKDNTFVLLLPKSFIEMVLPKINNKLMALGFNEGYLTLIKSSELDKVFSNDIYKNISIDMSHFDKFFIKEPEEKKPFDKYLQERILEKTPIPAKMIIATGHGAANASQVVGVKVEQYKEFLKILNKIKAKFLVVNSCYSGGENLLKMHDLLLSKMPGDFLALLNYPIVINATMAEVSIAGTPEKFENLNIFFRRIEPIIENKQFYFGVPVSRVEGLVKKKATGSIKEALTSLYNFSPWINNLPSIHMPGTNSFFRAVDVDNLLILTYVSLQQFKIAEKVRMALEEKKKLMSKIEPAEQGSVRIDEKEWISKVKSLPSPVLYVSSDCIERVMIYPSVIKDITLEIEKEAVPFTSHIRGDAQHFIEKIKSGKLSFSELLNKTFFAPFSLYVGREHNYGMSNIVWFIEELECDEYRGDNKITGLVIQKGIDGRGSIVAFRQGKDIYKILYVDLEPNKTLLNFEKNDKKGYENLVQTIYSSTGATKEALREASGGNENENTVREAYKNFAAKMGFGELLSDEQIKKNLFSQKELSSNIVTTLRRFSRSGYDSARIDEEIEAAETGIRSNEEQVRVAALDLWKALFEKVEGEGLETKNRVVDKGMELANGIISANLIIRNSAFHLWNLFFEKMNFMDLTIREKVLSKAIELIETGISSSDLYIKSSSQDLFKSLFKKIENMDSEVKDKVFGQLINFTDQGIVSDNLQVQVGAWALWSELVENTNKMSLEMKDKLFGQLINITDQGIGSDNLQEQVRALALWGELIKRSGMMSPEMKDKIFGKAIEIVEKGMESDNREVRMGSSSLCFDLLDKLEAIDAEKKDRVFNNAVKFLEIGRDANPLGTISRWQALFEKTTVMDLKVKNRVFDKAIEVAARAVGQEDFEGIYLWNALLANVELMSPETKDRVFDRTVDLAVSTINKSNSAGIDLWKVLFEILRQRVEEGQDFEKALDIAEKAMESRELGVRDGTYDLWQALVFNVDKMDDKLASRVFKRALIDGEEAISNINLQSQFTILDFWKSLFVKASNMSRAIQDQFFDKVLEIISKGINNTTDLVQVSAVMLCEYLPEYIHNMPKDLRNKVVGKAIDIASISINIDKPDVQISALKLWEALFEKGEGFKEAGKIDNTKLRELLNKDRPQKQEEEPRAVETLPAAEETPA